jgi:hypothetical protein
MPLQVISVVLAALMRDKQTLEYGTMDRFQPFDSPFSKPSPTYSVSCDGSLLWNGDIIMSNVKQHQAVHQT